MKPSSSPVEQPSFGVTVRHAIVLALLMYLLVAIFLLFFPHQASAGEQAQAHLLDKILGSVMPVEEGKFAPVDDANMAKELQGLIAQHQLDGITAAAYIVNLSRNSMAWAASKATQPFTLNVPADKFTVQFVRIGKLRLALQNFWVSQQDGQRENFRMVLALPID